MPPTPAAQYLSRRKIDAPLAQRFGLGLSADAWSGLTGAARSAGFDTAGLAGAGLAIQNTQSPGRYYDRFRNRLIFPIADTMGRPVAFGGRVYAPNAAPDEPKYVNSPETLLYRKGQLLYALHLAKDAIVREKRALLMEGYMDVIRAHQNGLTAAVASCGTALTIEQAQALKKLCGQVVFVYDGDEAGQNAMLRGCEILLECEFDIRIVALPKDHDPDSFLLKHGAEKFADMIGTAPDFFTFFLDGACRRYDTRTPTGKVQAADFLMPLLSRMKNPIARQAYTRQEAERLEIDDALIMQQLNNRAGPAMNRLKEQIENQASAEHKGEKMLLRLAVESPEVRAQLAKRFDLVWVRNPSLRSWLGTCISMGAHENISWDDLFASCATEDERGSLRALIIELDEWEPPNTSVRAIAHTLARIELNYRRRISRELVRQIDQFYQAGDEQETLACTRSLDETAKPVPALGRQYFIRRQNP
ncbi:MAG: toprim domain-containing protein [Candidatus Sumerlaeota bacterium]|nr:toprim domain-containing protein [Candidatus Sumerlaeota bacterium]